MLAFYKWISNEMFKRSARPNNNNSITYYLPVCYFLRILQYPVNTTYNSSWSELLQIMFSTSWFSNIKRLLSALAEKYNRYFFIVVLISVVSQTNAWEYITEWKLLSRSGLISFALNNRFLCFDRRARQSHSFVKKIN